MPSAQTRQSPLLPTPFVLDRSQIRKMSIPGPTPCRKSQYYYKQCISGPYYTIHNKSTPTTTAQSTSTHHARKPEINHHRTSSMHTRTVLTTSTYIHTCFSNNHHRSVNKLIGKSGIVHTPGTTEMEYMHSIRTKIETKRSSSQSQMKMETLL